MKFFDSDDWVLSSAGGLTGEAYMAMSGDHKLFIKRNTSPFLAVLSAEGIVPKLLWARRTGSGDVLTAQKWMNGRVLKPEEMGSKKVAALLKKIHTSDPLLFMLKRLGKKPVTTSVIFDRLVHRASGRKNSPALNCALDFLRKTSGRAEYYEKKVCHSDINHNNWLINEGEKKLYLVDWDQAVIADPAMDLAMLLYWYISEDKWLDWLKMYGWEMNNSLHLRLIWHMIASTIRFMFWHQEHGDARKFILFEKDLLWLNDYAARFCN
ncbi:phosphotransferase family protein [Sporolactobacillus sp. THM19-2]|uniref:phosphotransferase family protein n=1 Tax=Sporolactobacillus sp. THM19-2 TaxID=2511171 RepID=UPI001022866B|nr:phosphotransferase family protein [Sporolactobacillus sp. THM19-2]RYL94550.1 phosphotransferase [Sporolactobacillus sp. THM19-2]